jgi:hypothetical protein
MPGNEGKISSAPSASVLQRIVLKMSTYLQPTQRITIRCFSVSRAALVSHLVSQGGGRNVPCRFSLLGVGPTPDSG